MNRFLKYGDLYFVSKILANLECTFNGDIDFLVLVMKLENNLLYIYGLSLL